MCISHTCFYTTAEVWPKEKEDSCYFISSLKKLQKNLQASFVNFLR